MTEQTPTRRPKKEVYSKAITVYLEPEVVESFNNKCTDRCTNKTLILRKMIKDWINIQA